MLSVAVVAAIGLASCGGPGICDCVEMGEKMAKEMEEADGDADKIKEITESYKSEAEACEKLGEAAKDDEEAAKKMMEEAKECGK